jgi:hypothetical protein
MRKALIILLVALAGVVSASFISMTTSVSIESAVQSNGTSVNITMLNSGDEPAYDVLTSLALPEGFYSNELLVGTLNQNEPYTGEFKINIDESVACGTYTVGVITDYKDANSYPFSAVSTFSLILKNRTFSRVTATIPEITLGEKGSEDLKLSMRNLDDTPHSIQVKLLLPRELKVERETMTAFVDKKSDSEISFRLSSFGARPGSSYIVSAILSYDEEGRHYSSSSSGIVNIVEGGDQVSFQIPTILPQAHIHIVIVLVLILIFVSYNILLLILPLLKKSRPELFPRITEGIDPESIQKIKSIMETVVKIFVNLIVMFGIFWMLLSFFTPELLLSERITTGGDTASHYYTAQYLNDYLLPNGKISGWCPGNYAGFPMLEFYFPLPFLLMAFLSNVISLQVAFKLVSVLGIFLLPLAAFFCMSLMRFRFPMPIIAAVFTLPFLFMEANSMWGGNIPSTLAGEFCYGISLSLTILFFGSMYKGTTSGKYWIWNSLLLALIAFTHVYTLLFAVVSSVFLLFTIDKEVQKSRFMYMAKTYLLSFLLVAFWILPLIMNLHYTTSYDIVWIIHQIGEVFPLILVPFVALSILGMFSPLIYRTISRRDDDVSISYFYFPVLVASLFYLFAPYLGVVDIRFIPFIQLFIVLQAAYCLSRIASELKGRWLIPLIVLFLVIIWVNNAKMIEEHSKPHVDQIMAGDLSGFIELPEKWLRETIPEFLENKYYGFTPHWIKWNYEGFDGKNNTWGQFREINEFLNGSFQDSRVVYEHSEIHNRFGSSRAFESLPLFAGRATLEGLYMQSTVSSSFIFYIQSEVSEKQSCPFWANYPCTHFDLENGTEHLKIFNVGHFIAISDKAKNALASDPEYGLVKRARDYEIYELLTNENMYTVVPEYEPVLFKTYDWKQSSYDWFRRMDAIDVPVIFVRDFNGVRDNFPKAQNLDELPRIPVDNSCSINETILNEEIRIQTSCVGKPHIVRVSYFPNWRVDGADRIYRVSPSFMLVYPERENVRLYYGATVIDQIGSILTVIGVLVLLYTVYENLSRNQSFSRLFKR